MMIFVEAKGIEPLLEEPKSSVLPLDDASKKYRSLEGARTLNRHRWQLFQLRLTRLILNNKVCDHLYVLNHLQTLYTVIVDLN